ncbi:TonB family protein [Opitutus terrae]|uniref:TonB family protein n=1 Tax=Opitutus terrae (strain DSM 11246 / JCM 15787 / PB90-1) TaxID=452637 RepID=B1ZXS5_OPITP|nr:TonB family protein [Opitutus terrae]ACB74297.1 TonB family protein [Opitutus terrae PB90-1]
MSPGPRWLLRCCVPLFVLGWLSLMLAQDVTVGPISWLDADDPPDQLPTRKAAFRPEFPEELKQSPDLGWAMFEIWLSDDGRSVQLVTYGTQPAYADALEHSYDARLRFKPGKRDGRAVNTRVRVTAVFNPAGAALKRADATPRLLDAQVIIDPRQKPERREPMCSNRTVWANVRVRPNGEATLAGGAPDELADLLRGALPQWRFAPARRGGQPVEAELRVPFIVVPPEATSGGEQVPPKILQATSPHYPWSMQASGLRGDVVVEFVVDYEGRVRKPIVVRTLNPGFNAAAIEAISRWRFEPATVHGRPVNTLVQQGIRFELRDAPGGGSDGLEVKQKANLSKLPPELRYDTPPKLTTLVQPKYPYALLREGKRGTAQVTVLVGADGRVLEVRVAKAPQPELGYALEAAAEMFAFQPALKGGHPIPAMYGFEHDFDPSERTLVPESDWAALRLEQKHPEEILTANKLDQPIKPETTKPPRFPSSVPQEVVEGEAVVEVLIDHKGRVCVPRVVSASLPEFGYAAVQAVAEWRFDPPTSGGKPGAVRVSVPFAFKRPPLAAPASPPSS